MTYQILSLGDAEMLSQAFNGAAAIFNSGAIGNLMRVGFLTGLIFVAVKYLFSYQFSLQSLLVAFIVYSLLFVPKSEVVVEDMYTGQVYPVANVPVGVALPMSLVTTAGASLTQLFETAFSTPDESKMLNGGYLDPLKTLVKLRYLTMGDASSTGDITGSIDASVNEYIDGCVAFDLKLKIPEGEHEVTRERLKKAADLWPAMKTTFINRDVMVYLPNFSGQASCKAAYEKLDDYFSSSEFSELWQQYLHGFLGIEDDSMTPDDQLTKATTALAGEVGMDSQRFVMNVVMASYLRDGPSAVIQRPALEQLKLQWAGEKSVFEKTARPLISFVEVFTVAISPIVAFTSTLGILGGAMLIRYFQMLLWVSLWGPIMAVCNMYITIVTTRVLTTLATQAQAGGSDLAAMGFHDRFFDELEIWLATGGMLAASVPAIALMIVYGGSNAAVNLAGRMSSAATSAVKPERMMPEAVSMGAVANLGSHRDVSPNVGQTMSGWNQPTYNATQSLDSGIQSARNVKDSANASVQKSKGAMEATSTQTQNVHTSGTTVADKVLNSSGSIDKWSTGIVDKKMDELGWSENEKKAVKGAASVALSASAVTGDLFPLLKLGVEGSLGLDSSSGLDETKVRQLGHQIASDISSGHEDSQQFQKAHETAKATSDQSVLTTGQMRQQTENYVDALQKAHAAETGYQELAGLRQSVGQSYNPSFGQLANQLVKNGGLVELASVERDMAAASPETQAKWQQAKADARRQINASGLKLPGDEYDALQQFLGLDKMNPGRAAGIAVKTLMPTLDGLDSQVTSPGQYKSADTPDSMVSKGDADAMRDKAQGGASTPGGQPDASPHKARPAGGGRSGSAGDGGPSGQADGNGSPARHGGSSWMDGNPQLDKEWGELKQRPWKVDGADTSRLTGDAAKLEGHALKDNIVKPVVETTEELGKSLGSKVYDIIHGEKE